MVTMCTLLLFAFYLGKEALYAWHGLCIVTMNIFFLKEINIGPLCVTTTDALSCGYLLSLSIIQEYFGKEEAKHCAWTGFFISFSFCIFSLFQILYISSSEDLFHDIYKMILFPSFRIMGASIISFMIVQLLDMKLFSYLRKKTEGKFFVARVGIILPLIHICDTFIFIVLGLSGIVSSIWHIMLMSLCIKLITSIVCFPFLFVCNRIYAWKDKSLPF